MCVCVCVYVCVCVVHACVHVFVCACVCVRERERERERKRQTDRQKKREITKAPFSILPTSGADVVLGHVSKTNEGSVPAEQQLRRLRHSPGSGVLTVEMRSEGPTRVLHIADQNKKVQIFFIPAP